MLPTRGVFVAREQKTFVLYRVVTYRAEKNLMTFINLFFLTDSKIHKKRVQIM